MMEQIIYGEGLAFEKFSESESRIHFDERQFIVNEDELHRVAEEIYRDTDGAISVNFGRLRYGGIMIFRNLALRVDRETVAQSMAKVYNAIESMHITKRLF